MCPLIVLNKYKKVSWQRPTLPGSRPPSTIGADSLNGRVRDVTGCTTVAPVTKRIVFYQTTLRTNRFEGCLSLIISVRQQQSLITIVKLAAG